MQQTTAQSPTPPQQSFAGLLASLAAPTPRTAWNNDDLAEDVGTLSYEHALRAHARYKVDDAVEAPKALAGPGGAAQRVEGEPTGASRTEALWAAPGCSGAAETGAVRDSSTTVEENKKCASITIRLSKTECDQLRRRAAQAGLTVSAYLRSCTFEAEALRAQVKEVLAELRQSTVAAEESKSAAGRRRRFGWVSRLMLGRRRDQQMAQS